MQIESGKFYKTRDGRKLGPMGTWSQTNTYRWSDKSGDGSEIWADNGSFLIGEDSASDLIAEWPTETTGPVRTVTRKEIVPGVYERLTVAPAENGNVAVKFNGALGSYSMLSASELRAAIATLTEIAEALEEQA